MDSQEAAARMNMKAIDDDARRALPAAARWYSDDELLQGKQCVDSGRHTFLEGRRRLGRLFMKRRTCIGCCRTEKKAIVI